MTSDNSVVQYAYNYDGEITATRINGVLMQKTTYSNGKESGYSIANENYSLVRSSEYLDRVTGINHSGCRMLTIGYNSNGDIELTTYANGATIDYNYDNRRLTGVELKDSPASDVTAINGDYILYERIKPDYRKHGGYPRQYGSNGNRGQSFQP